jgi:hypothetical protein
MVPDLWSYWLHIRPRQRHRRLLREDPPEPPPPTNKISIVPPLVTVKVPGEVKV